MQATIDFLDDPLSTNGSRSPARLQKYFSNPVAVLRAERLADIAPLLQAVQAHAHAGRWCVGYIAYEAAPAFDSAMRTRMHSASNGPLAQFAVYDQAHDLPAPFDVPSKVNTSPWTASWSYAQYTQAFDRVQQAISHGECYQINLTHALCAGVKGEPEALFAALRALQPDGYCAWLDWGEQQVLSVSPELFFDWRVRDDQHLLTTQPMKGTAPRHSDVIADKQAAAQLQASEKERAENLMIVDLLRNDLGRIAQIGSVKVHTLFELQALPTVWQMTSTITASTRTNISLLDVFRALFPCGSVTGAPKLRAMHWIATLETQARGVYCGAVGVVRPSGAATFNVPIRTLTLKQTPTQVWQARYHVGSGVTHDANAPAEWAEIADKTRILARAVQGSNRLDTAHFALLETLRLEDGAYWLLDEHLSRLSGSAAYFGFDCDLEKLRAALANLALEHSAGIHRVRLTLSAAGEVQLQRFDLAHTPAPVRFALNTTPLATRDEALRPFIENKTTHRSHYDNALIKDTALFDTLLLNESGELTEFTRGNLALLINGEWLTPRKEAGLLAGAYRTQLLRTGEIKEAQLTQLHLAAATKVVFFNSLRGWIEAQAYTYTGTSTQ